MEGSDGERAWATHRTHVLQFLLLLPDQGLQALLLPLGLAEAPFQLCALRLQLPLRLLQLRELRLILVPHTLHAGRQRQVAV